MIDKDCWNLVPPMPTTSAISWLTEMMTLGTDTQAIKSPSYDGQVQLLGSVLMCTKPLQGQLCGLGSHTGVGDSVRDFF